jgi:glycosyltransferase involved in cell wall biosynthesis
MKRWWEATGSAPDRTPWIPYGVSPARFSPVEDARAKLGIPPDDVVLVYAGRLSPEKGLLDLLSAVTRVVEGDVAGRLRVELIGDGVQRQEIERFVEARSLQAVVRLHGWLRPEGLPVWYTASDAFVLPSHSEPFGRVVSEAMLCGAPVIVSSAVGAADYVVTGLNGLVFPVGDVDALSRALAEILADPSSIRSLRQATLAYAREHLTWPRIVERICREVYAPLVEGAHGP